ncbi:hypothetical protein ACOSQ2_002785 [Xanthoceras sorbifolium]
MDCRSGASFLGLSSSKSRCKFLWGTNIPPKVASLCPIYHQLPESIGHALWFCKFRRNHFVHSGVLFEAVDSVGWAAQLLFAHPSGGSSSSQSWLPPASSLP